MFGIGIGTYAEFAAAKESKLVHKPDTISFEHAAVATVSGITALQALTTIGQVEPGQHVLVIGASGGVGSFTVQLAKALGATHTGVASTSELGTVLALGAGHTIDYTRQHIDHDDQQYDLIIGTGGLNKLARLRRALTPAGTLVIVGGEDGGRLTGGIGRPQRAALLSRFVKQRLIFFVSKESLESIEALAAYLADGSVKAQICQRFELDEVPRAIEAMEAGELTAKAVIKVKS